MIDLVETIDDALGTLADETTELGIFAEEVYKNAAAAFYEQPEQAARIALDTERVCQQVYHTIHQKGLAVLAWYQPTTDEVHRVVELQHIAAELARIGYNGRLISEQALALRGSAEALLRQVQGPAPALLVQLIRQAYREVRGCVVLTTTRDTVLAKRLLAEDPELDRIFLSYRAALEEAIHRYPQHAAPFQRLLLAGVHIEDIGNRVVAIARGLLSTPPPVSP